MAGSNRFASLSNRRVREARLSHDEYETPDKVTELLFDRFAFTEPDTLDPCCVKQARILNVAQSRNYDTSGYDIRTDGYNYLEDDSVWSGDIITNPPYHGGLADAFVAHALAKSTGDVDDAVASQASLSARSAPTRFLLSCHRPTCSLCRGASDSTSATPTS